MLEMLNLTNDKSARTWLWACEGRQAHPKRRMDSKYLLIFFFVKVMQLEEKRKGWAPIAYQLAAPACIA